MRRVVSLDSDDENIEMLKSVIDERRENERNRVKIEHARLYVERKEASERVDEAERDQGLEKKWLDIQQRELYLARQMTFAEFASQRAQMGERKSMVSVLSSLAKKIGSSEYCCGVESPLGSPTAHSLPFGI